jgi:hypothetical protein
MAVGVGVGMAVGIAVAVGTGAAVAAAVAGAGAAVGVLSSSSPQPMIKSVNAISRAGTTSSLRLKDIFGVFMNLPLLVLARAESIEYCCQGIFKDALEVFR